MRILLLIVVVVVLVGCSTNGKKTYNPITTIIRIATGNFK